MKVEVTVITTGTRTYRVEIPDDTPLTDPQVVYETVFEGEREWENDPCSVDLEDDETVNIYKDGVRLWVNTEYDDQDGEGKPVNLG